MKACAIIYDRLFISAVSQKCNNLSPRYPIDWILPHKSKGDLLLSWNLLFIFRGCVSEMENFCIGTGADTPTVL